MTIEDEIKAAVTGDRTRPVVVSRRDAPVTTVGAAAVARRLEALVKQTEDLLVQAGVLATALAGPPMPTAANLADSPAGEHLFARQLHGLEQLATILTEVDRQLARARAALE